MGEIDARTTLEQLAAIVSQALEAAGVTATLSGGAAVTIYAENEYLSGDLDFVTSARADVIFRALAPLGFRRQPGAREMEHPETAFYVEFPPGPLAFGETVVSDADAAVLQTAHGPVRIVTPTQLVMDRLSAYVHWHDGQSFDQAAMVARRQDIDWAQLGDWAEKEEIDPGIILRLRERSTGQ